MLSTTEVFLPSKRKGLLQHTVDNEVFALKRLAFLREFVDWARNECLLSALTVVRIKRVE